MDMSQLRSGSFLNAERRKVYSIITLIVTIAGLIYMFSRTDALIMADGQPIGTDFSNVYTAGSMIHEGRAADVWDWGQHAQAMKDIFGSRLDAYYAWHYPPFFLFIASVFAFLPYLWALILWQLSTLAGFTYSIKKIMAERPGWLLPTLGFPAVFVNMGHGQNAFLTAMLFGLSMFYLNKKPILAGILIGLMAYKPQFGFLIPLALLAGGYYKTFFSAGITVLIMSALATVTFGMDIWPAFMESMTLTRDIILEDGSTGWHKIQSAFSAIMNWTGNVTVAYAVHGLIALFITATIFLAFRKPVAHEDRAALLILGSLMFTPYMLDYDMVVVGPAIAFLVYRGLKSGFRPWEVLLLLLLWFAPLLTRPLMMGTGIPVGFLIMCIIFVKTAKDSVYTSSLL